MTDGDSSIWDAHAASFDEEPDHGLTDPAVRSAWATLLVSALPDAPASIVDIGCGTGSLAVLAAELGHRLCGLDSSPAMLTLARRKAADHDVTVSWVRGDASRPPFAPGSFDVVLVRHVLWAAAEPEATLTEWIDLLRGPRGRLVLVEGRWATGAGLPAAQCASLVRGQGRKVEIRRLDDDALWGKPVTDERYLLVSRG